MATMNLEYQVVAGLPAPSVTVSAAEATSAQRHEIDTGDERNEM